MNEIKITRVQLYEMVWLEPMSTIAKSYKITYTDLRKACKNMNIPTPPNGHWMKLLHGKNSPKVELPFEYDGVGVLEIEQQGKEAIITGESELSKTKKEILADTRLNLKVPSTLKNACSLVLRVNDVLRERMKDEYYREDDLLGHYGPFLDVKVMHGNLDRMLRFADALIKNLETRGHKIYFENKETKLDLFGEQFKIAFRECCKREIVKHPGYSWESSRLVPTGVLSFRITNYQQREWREGKLTLEQQLPAILAQLEVIGLKKKREMDLLRIRWAEQEKEAELRKQLLKRKEEELQLFQNLFKESEHFDKAQIIRKYVSEIEKRSSSETLPAEKNSDWIRWAKDKADWIDPLVAKNDVVLGDFNDKMKLNA